MEQDIYKNEFKIDVLNISEAAKNDFTKEISDLLENHLTDFRKILHKEYNLLVKKFQKNSINEFKTTIYEKGERSDQQFFLDIAEIIFKAGINN
jgi:hypothetical protein